MKKFYSFIALAAAIASVANAQNTIEGTWSFPIMSQFSDQAEPSKETINCQAVLEGTTVYFTPQYDKGEGNVFVAELEGTTLTFSKLKLGSDEVLYPLWQVPCINETNTTDLEALAEMEVESFTATFDDVAGTIEFDKANSTLLFGHLTQEGKFERVNNIGNPYWEDAFLFDGTATRNGALQPVLTVSNTAYTLNGSNATVTADVTAERFELSDAASWKAVVKTWDAGAEDWMPFQTVDATVANGVATFTIINLPQGNSSYVYSLQALDAQGAVIVTSNEKGLTVDVGAAISVMSPKVEVDGHDATLTINITLLQGFDNNTVYKVKFTHNPQDTEANVDEESFEMPATVVNNIATMEFTDLAAGTYDYIANLVAYNTAGTLLATSNNVTVYFKITDDIDSGVEIIGNDNAPAVIYNLQGVRVNGDNIRPGIYIINGKKVVIR